MANRKINAAIIGATGLVGRTMIKVLEERRFPVNQLKLVASEQSEGKKLKFKDSEIEVKQLTGAAFEDTDIALFSAGKTISRKFAPIAAKMGCIVIDNSSAWRMEPDIPLIVPEVNSSLLKNHNGIIANPNCSTIQLVVVLKVLHDLFVLKRVVCSTYQSVSGAGQEGIDHLMAEIEGREPEKRISPYQLAYNTAFHTIDSETFFTEEEEKMINETRKIMRLPHLPLAMTCVRVPVLGGHGEAVNVEFENRIDFDKLIETLDQNDGIVVIDDPKQGKYPTPHQASGTDPVYAGRIRKDDSVENGLYVWIVADNLRKGAATNAVQIAEKIVDQDLFDF